MDQFYGLGAVEIAPDETVELVAAVSLVGEIKSLHLDSANPSALVILGCEVDGVSVVFPRFPLLVSGSTRVVVQLKNTGPTPATVSGGIIYSGQRLT